MTIKCMPRDLTQIECTEQDLNHIDCIHLSELSHVRVFWKV